MKNLIGLLVFLAWATGAASAESITVIPAGECRGFFRPVNEDGVMFRNPNAAIQGDVRCTLLLRTNGKRLNKIRLLDKKSRYSNTNVSRTFRVRSTSSGYAIDFNYNPNTCFYYIEAQGAQSNLSVTIGNSKLTSLSHEICYGAFYLAATRIGPSPPASTTTAKSALECSTKCTTESLVAGGSCYGSTFSPGTNDCLLFSKTDAQPCTALTLSMDAESKQDGTSSSLFPDRYSSVARSCVTTTPPAATDRPPYVLPTKEEKADAAIGTALESVEGSVIRWRGATIFEAGINAETGVAGPPTTLLYLGSVAKVASSRACTGICQQFKKGSQWTRTPTDFTGTWAQANGYFGVTMGPVASTCVANSYYAAAPVNSESDDQFGYICDLWGKPETGTLPSLTSLPQEPGGKNAVTVLMRLRWKAVAGE